MIELKEICEKIEHSVFQLREKIAVRHWANYSRPAFVNNLAAITPELEDLYSMFQMARGEIEKSPRSPKPEISGHIKELSQLITVLKRNREMEELRIEKVRAQGIHGVAEAVTVPELYSDLEQKTLAILLKSTYCSERIRVFERKQEPMMQSRGAQKTIIDLLEKKEEELESLRKKYEENRKNAFLGIAEKESSVQIENELNEAARNLETKTAVARKMFDEIRKDYSEFENKMRELEERIKNIEEIESQLVGKTFETVTMIKKERDYAKKMLIEIEQETISLRNTYSKELLGLHEQKVAIKQDLESKYSKENADFRHELRHKNEMLKHFSETSTSKEKKIAELEEEVHRLRLVAKALHTHGEIRKKFGAKSEKRKR